MGIDISKNVETGESLVEAYNNNLNTGVSAGGPQCTCNGQNLPRFVCCLPNASITSELLVEMMMPVLLLDGHHSQTRLPFLKYVDKENH
jgi:hypothetical protein